MNDPPEGGTCLEQLSVKCHQLRAVLQSDGQMERVACPKPESLVISEARRVWKGGRRNLQHHQRICRHRSVCAQGAVAIGVR